MLNYLSSLHAMQPIHKLHRQRGIRFRHEEFDLALGHAGNVFEGIERGALHYDLHPHADGAKPAFDQIDGDDLLHGYPHLPDTALKHAADRILELVLEAQAVPFIIDNAMTLPQAGIELHDSKGNRTHRGTPLVDSDSPDRDVDLEHFSHHCSGTRQEFRRDQARKSGDFRYTEMKTVLVLLLAPGF